MMDLQCSSLTNLHRYKSRDLFSSHAKRIGSTKKQVVTTKCRNYQPRTCPNTPYSTPRPSYQPSHNNVNYKKKSSKSSEIEDQLNWLRRVTNKQYQAPTTYGSLSRSSSRYSSNKSVQNHFLTARNKKYKRPFSSLTYKSILKKSNENKAINQRPQTAKIMLSNKMLSSPLSTHRNLRYKDDNNSNDFTLSGWSLKDKGKRTFVFDENANINKDNQQKPKIDTLDINNIIDTENDAFKTWPMPKNNLLSREDSYRSLDIISNVDHHENVQNPSLYLTNVERESFTTRSVLQNPTYTNHLYTHRPQSVPCGGMKFSDFEKLKIDLSKNGITVHRSSIENGLSTPHPTFNCTTTNNVTEMKYKYPFPIPGEMLIAMKEHGLEPKFNSVSRGGKKKKGKKSKKSGKKKKKKK